MVELFPNWILLKIDLEAHTSQIADAGFLVDKRFNPQAYMTTNGIVAQVCDRLEFSWTKQGAEARLEYDSPIELQVGDRAYLNFLSIDKAIKSGRLIKEGDEDFVLVRYDRFYGVLRDARWHGINGWKIGTLNNDKQSFGIVEKQVLSSQVLGEGSPVKHYWDKRYKETGEIKRGDIVTFCSSNPIDTWISGVNLVKFQERDVLTVNGKPFRDCLEIEVSELPSKNQIHAEYKHLSHGVVKDAPLGFKPFIGQEILFMGDMLYGVGDKWYVKRVQEIVDLNGKNLIIGI